jgi:site-specific DNA-methyltransferase (adenine-specific)
MRIETIGDATLYLGDCREWVASLPVCFRADALVTDPPYGIGFAYYSYDDSRANLEGLITSAVAPLLERTTRAVITPGQTQVWLYPAADWIASIHWDTTATFGSCGYSQWMPVLFYGQDVPGFGRNASGWLKSDVIRFTGGAGVGFQRDAAERAHTCPKPLNVMEALISRFSDPGETVIDPFLGSGTTGVACAKLGRRFLGVELEERYFDIACRRIEDAYRQPRLFDEPAPKPIQPSLLDNAT